MKLTNGEIFSIMKPLEELMGKELPVKVSYELAKLSSKLKSQFEIIETVRRGLIRTHGKPDPLNPQQSSVTPESEGWGKFTTEVDELMSQEFEVVFNLVKLPDTLEIKPSVMVALEKLVKA